MENHFNLGDIIMPTKESGFVLRSGASIYTHAYVVSLDPFTLVSEDADMKWWTTVKPEYFARIGSGHYHMISERMNNAGLEQVLKEIKKEIGI